MADLWDSTKFAVEDFREKLLNCAYEPHAFFAADLNGTPDVTQMERAVNVGNLPVKYMGSKRSMLTNGLGDALSQSVAKCNRIFGPLHGVWSRCVACRSGITIVK